MVLTHRKLTGLAMVAFALSAACALLAIPAWHATFGQTENSLGNADIASARSYSNP